MLNLYKTLVGILCTVPNAILSGRCECIGENAEEVYKNGSRDWKLQLRRKIRKVGTVLLSEKKAKKRFDRDLQNHEGAG